MTDTKNPPEYGVDAFNCPHCNAFAQMSWQGLRTTIPINETRFSQATCVVCKEESIWLTYETADGLSPLPTVYGHMVYPTMNSAPLANPDLPDECRQDYEEARAIAQQSPRAAAALLRLCLEKLCIHLGGKGQNINQDIQLLVKNGLPVRVQQALDIVRVTGNNAVHPGKIPTEEIPERVNQLFSLINIIVDNQITQPKHIAEIYDSLPEGALKGIERRDQPS